MSTGNAIKKIHLWLFIGGNNDSRAITVVNVCTRKALWNRLNYIDD